MSEQSISRRQFLRVASLGAAGAAVIACQPQTVVVKETVEVEKLVKETVEVEKEVTTVVEKEVTKVVEVEVTLPAPPRNDEAPELASKVAAGSLPPVDDRLPADLEVIKPWESIGEYGGTWRMITGATPEIYWAYACYEFLLRFRMWDYAVAPNVAQSWENKDGKVFTFHMRKGLKWSDGQPLTAEDVIFFYDDNAANEEISPVFPGWLKAGEERPQVEMVDDYTVRFTYTQPAALFERQVAQQWRETFWAKHYLQQFHPTYTDRATVEQMAKDEQFDTWVAMYLARRDYRTNPELPLPYAWTAVEVAQDSIIYDRNPFYWKVDTDGNQLPYISGVATITGDNLDARQLKVFAGEADAQLFSVGQFPKDTMILKKNEELGDYHVIDAPISEPNVFVFGFNLNHSDEGLREVFSDRRFRFAMSLGINREDIRQLIYLDQPKEIRQVSPLPHSPFYHKAAAQNYVEFDPDEANRLLDEMGLTERGGDGFRLRLDGEPLTFTVEIMANRDDFIDACEMITEWWRDLLGVNATVKAVEDSLYFTRFRAGELDAGVDYSGNGYYPISGPNDYIPIANNAVWAPLWGLWYASEGESGIEPPNEVKQQLDLYTQILVTPDQDEQVALWKQIMDIQAENLYHLGICDRATVPCPVSNRTRNFPDVGWDCEWGLGNVGVTHPEQFWFTEK